MGSLIGASLSKPYTSEVAKKFALYIYIFVCIRTYSVNTFNSRIP